MRTHRLELRVSKAEKARIEREAAILGTSPGDYVRKAAMLLDAEDIVGLEDVRSLWPEFNAALDRIHDVLVATAERSERYQEEIARMRTPEYREDVRRSVLTDEAGLDPTASLPGFGRPEHPPSFGEASAGSGLAEPRAQWAAGDRPEDEEQPE